MKLKRFFVIFLLFIIMMSACTSTKLADIYDENIIIERAKKVVEIINSQDFDSVNAELRADLQDQLTSSKMNDTIGVKIVAAGPFVKYQSISTLGQKSKSTGEDYASVVLVGEYEKGTVVFTITMDSNLDIVGIYVK